jgi:multidrug efflux pump subunit AcrA (membrane-fusion protein)
LIAATVTGCDKPVPPTSQARPVRTVTVERRAEGETVSLTGHVRAKDQLRLAFRLDGRMIERLVNVGDVVTAGQVVAKLDPQVQQRPLRSAQGNWWLEATRRPGFEMASFGNFRFFNLGRRMAPLLPQRPRAIAERREVLLRP